MGCTISRERWLPSNQRTIPSIDNAQSFTRRGKPPTGTSGRSAGLLENNSANTLQSTVDYPKKTSGFRRTWITMLSWGSSVFERQNTGATILGGEDRVQREGSPGASGSEASSRAEQLQGGYDSENMGREIPVSQYRSIQIKSVAVLLFCLSTRAVPGTLYLSVVQTHSASAGSGF
jgi:hypothetical protein